MAGDDGPTWRYLGEAAEGGKMGRLAATARIPFVTMGVAALLLSACAKQSPSGSGGLYGGGGTPSSSSSGGGGGGTGALSTGSVSGIGKVAVDAQGMTLYHITSETGGQIVCTGSCASVWPPLLTGGMPTGSSGITGKVGTVHRPDGTTQVTLDGLPLYTYSGDSAPGQGNGEGIQGVWFAVSPAGAIIKKGSGSGGGRY
jgi:predicted lipoprotein with Yx(FWY)xxD motif